MEIYKTILRVIAIILLFGGLIGMIFFGSDALIAVLLSGIIAFAMPKEPLEEGGQYE